MLQVCDASACPTGRLSLSGCGCLQIEEAANRIAHYLRDEAGVEPGSIVGILLLRSPLMVAALLGVFKVGAGYLPLDHHHPDSRTAFTLEDAAVKVRTPRCNVSQL